MYYLLGISLSLASVFCLNFLLSAAVTAVWRAIEKLSHNWSVRRRTAAIFALRVFPGLFAIVFVFAFLLPAYLLFEPYATNEKVTWKLFFPALFAVIGIIIATYRILGTWWKTRRLVKSFLKRSEQIFIENVPFPVYRIRHNFPVIAVVGAFRPKMFIAEQIFSSLDKQELAAAVAHECGHLAARDNLKRLVLEICRDLLVFPFGKYLDKKWSENIEAAADEYAALEGGNPAALHLAAALVKIARIVPKNSSPLMPQGAFLVENQSVDINWRVRRLLKLAEAKKPAENQSRFNLGFIYGIGFLSLFLLILTLEFHYGFFHKIHIIQESIVHILQ